MVDWEDHTASAEWEDDVDSCTYEVCRTIGWLIKEDKKSYKIAKCSYKRIRCRWNFCYTQVLCRGLLAYRDE